MEIRKASQTVSDMYISDTFKAGEQTDVVSSAQVFAEYVEYCSRHAVIPQSQSEFGKRLKAKLPSNIWKRGKYIGLAYKDAARMVSYTFVLFSQVD